MEIIKKNLYQKIWRVPSKSEKEKWHEVVLLKDRRYKCQCIANGIGAECSHIKIVKLHENRI